MLAGKIVFKPHNSKVYTLKGGYSLINQVCYIRVALVSSINSPIWAGPNLEDGLQSSSLRF